MSRLLLVLVLLLAGIARPAQADELVALVGAWHSNPGACRGEIGRDCRNDAVGLLYQADSGLTVGAMRNSLGRGSAIVGRTLRLDLPAGFAAELPILLSTGYPAAPVVPLASPTLAMRAGRFTFRAGFLPPVKWRNISPTSVIHFSVGVRL